MYPYRDKMRCKGIKYFDCSKFFFQKKHAGSFVPEHKTSFMGVYMFFYRHPQFLASENELLSISISTGNG